MRERPIIFTGASVRAMLAGRKTQTRRVVRPQPPNEATSAGVIDSAGPSDGEWSWLSGDPRDSDSWGAVGDPFRCPYGGPGDRLWVRETWKHYGNAWHSGEPQINAEIAYQADDSRREVLFPDGLQPQLRYRDFAGQRVVDSDWRPSMFMPRWASRLLLEVADVRVQRVQEISEADAIAEGFEFQGDQPSPRDEFSGAWDAINGSRRVREYDGELGSLTYGRMRSRVDNSHSWAANPWVWVITFRRAAVTPPATVNGERMERRA